MRIGGAVQAELKVSVSESVDRELASVDGFQQLMIFGLEKVQRADPPSLILTRPLKAAGEFAEPSAVVHRTESVPVAFVGFLGNLGAPVQIGHSPAHRPPLEVVFGAAFFGPKGLEDFDVLGQGFDPIEVSHGSTGFAIAF